MERVRRAGPSLTFRAGMLDVRSVAGLALGLLILAGCGSRSKPTADPDVAPPGRESSPNPPAIGKAPNVRLTGGGTASDPYLLEANEISPTTVAKLSRTPANDPLWRETLSVAVLGSAAEGKTTPRFGPSLAGAYSLDESRGVLRFAPKYALQPGLTYRVTFNPAPIADETIENPSHYQGITLVLSIPARKVAEPTRIVEIFPTSDALPENLLKIYVHFSRPMSRGEAYRRLHLLDAEGKPVEDAFLELGEELWDPTGTRFTLLFDPGRVKRGLRPREEEGAALVAGNRYTFVVDADWRDAEGQPLAAGARRDFVALTADFESPNPKDWTSKVPPAGSRAPLLVIFPESLDEALLRRLLRVVDHKGTPIAGAISIAEQETHWRFEPQEPWRTGAYRLVVEPTLEDLAGNSVGRPFEVDVSASAEGAVDPTPEPRDVEIPFEISGAVSRTSSAGADGFLSAAGSISP